MKKSLAKKVTLSILAGAMLMTSSVAWAEASLGVNVGIDGNGDTVMTSFYIGPSNTDDSGFVHGDYSVAIGAGALVGGGSSNPPANNAVAIGHNAHVGGAYQNDGLNGVAIGDSVFVHGTNNVGIGAGARVNASNSVALGYGSVADTNNVVSVGNGSVYRKIVNVSDGSISANSHDAITGGQLYENYYSKSEIDTKLTNKANVADVYNKTDADAKFATKEYVDNTFVKIEDNKISNNGDITFDVGTTSTDNVVKISTTGITVGSTSTHIDGKGVYVGAHNFEDAKSAMNDEGEIKGAGGKFKVGTDGSVKAADGNFTVDASGKVTAKEVTADNLYTKTEIDGMLGGSSNAIAGINQRLEKTNAKINKVGAGAAALAALHPLEYDPDDKLTFSAGMGNYAGENAAALGAFYRPNEKFMVSLGGTMGNGENMVNLGLSIGLDKPNGFAKMSKRELIQKVNAMEAKYEAVEAEKEAMKAEMAEMKAMLKAIMAKK